MYVHKQYYGCAKWKVPFCKLTIQLIISITRNQYCFNYYKETGHVNASNINSHSMFEMSTGYFYARMGPSAGQQYCCINWVSRQVSPDRFQNGLHIRSVVRF